MAVISIIVLILVLLIILIINKESKTGKEMLKPDDKWKKIGLSILLFLPLFVTYYMIIAIIICIPLAITMVAGQAGWVYGIIGGFALSPVLTIITIVKTVWRKNDKKKI